MQWKPIEECPKESSKMFVVKTFKNPVEGAFKGYTTDPYCVWHSRGEFHRWPHPFPPTHFCELPENI